MNCTDVAARLDLHSSARGGPAERADLDEHLAGCEDCAAAWRAETQLLALRIPPVPATLLERALLAARVAHSAQPRRARAPLVIAGLLLTGAALAAMTIVSVTRSPLLETTSSDSEPSAPANEQPVVVGGVAGDSNASEPRGRTTSVELVETALSLAPIVRRPPDYPPRALEEGLEGHVQVRFAVTAAGTVENLTVVESSDAQFEAPAMSTVSAWRYLPRIVAGKRVRTDGIHTVIRFALGGDRRPPSSKEQQTQQEALRELRRFSNGVEVAVDRLAADDLRGAELQLDEMQAMYGSDRIDLWRKRRPVLGDERARGGTVGAAREPLLRASSIRSGAADAAAPARRDNRGSSDRRHTAQQPGSR
jgi:TonB family protein